VGHALVALVVLAALAAAVYLVSVVEAAWPLSLGIALSVFSGRWSHLGVPVGLDRILIGLGVAALVLRIGPNRHRPPIRLGFTHLVLVAASAFAVCSAIWAETLTTRVGGFRLIDSFGIAPYAAFAVAPAAFATANQRRILLGTLVALGAYLGVTALAEATHANVLVVPKYILDPQFGIHADRARGPFVEAVGNGLGLFCCAVAAVLAARLWTTPRARAVAWAVAAVCVAGIPVTYTRSVWIGAIAAVVVTMAVTARLRPWLVPALGGVAVAIGIAVLTLPSFGQKLEKRYHEQGPVYVRENTNRAALNIIASNPVAGAGWNRFVPASLDEFRIVGDAPPSAGIGEPAHNVYLSRGAELGLLGGGLWALGLLLGLGGALVRPVAAVLRPWRPAYVAILTCWAVVGMLAPLDYTFPTLLVWVWAGLLAARRPA
jgi:O-antigen ligase